MKHFLALVALGLMLITGLNGQALRPYTVGLRTTGDINAVEKTVVEKLQTNGFRVLGSYTPASDDTRRVVVVTSKDLLDAVGSKGGLTAFASALRVGITLESGKVIVSYTTPEYWGNAYFRDDYPVVEKNIQNVSLAFHAAFNNAGNEQFGSEDGIPPDKLRNYRYMIGMPKFDDTELLGTFKSFEEAVGAVENGLSKNKLDLTKVYSVEVPSRNLRLYGIAISGEDGEASFMPVIDIDSPKHTAFLPYELLVVNNEVHMLHGRFRIALSFPDLTMGTFMKIVSTPKDIHRLFEALVNDPLIMN